jgi:hypothetical protein
MNAQKSERGQAIILIAIMFIVLLGFAGLAIDAGMVYSDRRNAQNAADAASLAGGARAAIFMENARLFSTNWDCTVPNAAKAMQTAVNAAIERAGNNQYVIDGEISDGNGVTVSCTNIKGVLPQRYLDITVHITTVTEATFSQFLFGGPLRSEVEAVTRVRPRVPLAEGQAIVGMNTGACFGNQNGVIIGGSSDSLINGGGIFSNGCLKGDGSKFSVTVTNGGVSYAGTATGTLGGVSPAPKPTGGVTIGEELVKLDFPNCNDPKAIKHTNEVKITNNNTLELAPGLHCFYGYPRALTMTGGEIKGEKITIFMPNSGAFAINGGLASLYAPVVSDFPAPAVPGLLIYNPQGDISITGNGDSYYQGTILAPNGDIKAAGTGSTGQTFNTQLIGLNVDISGNYSLSINFRTQENATLPTTMDLFK